MRSVALSTALSDIAKSDSGRARNANAGNNFTVGFLEVDTRDELRTGYTTPNRDNAKALDFISFNFRLLCFIFMKQKTFQSKRVLNILRVNFG